MPTDGHREQVMTMIRLSAKPLDDDQIADRTGISPRQRVNQVCRALERAGIVRRRIGPHSSSRPAVIVAGNGVLGGDAASPAALAVPDGDSGEQRAAERVMLDLLGAQLGRALNPARITVPSGDRVEVDGADAGRTVLAECWAHQGPPKSAQRHKVLADAFKLAWIANILYPRPQLILCLSDPLAAAPFLPAAPSWAARALQDHGITVSVVSLPDDLRQRLLQAQRRQYR
jgi:hypothetical protein